MQSPAPSATISKPLPTVAMHIKNPPSSVITFSPLGSPAASSPAGKSSFSILSEEVSVGVHVAAAWVTC